MSQYKAVPYTSEQSPYESRFCIVDANTGEIVDDAQGWGYKTAQKAHAAWAYKNKTKSQRAQDKKKARSIRGWLKNHPDFTDAMLQYSFEIAKGSWGPNQKFDAVFVGELLKNYDLDPPFTPGQILRTWQRM